MPLAFAIWRFSSPHSVEAEAEAYAVYSSYIESRLRGGVGKLDIPGADILICSEPAALYQKPVWKFFVAGLRSFSGNLGSAYSLFYLNVVDRGRRNNFLDGRFALPHPYKLASSEDVLHLLDQTDSSKPHRGDAFSFSTVAFSNDLTEALFYADHRCGSLCGDEMYMFMRKINGKWIIQGHLVMGVA